MRKLLYGLLGVILIALAGFFLLVPGMAERDMNQIDGKPLIEESDEAKTLHATLDIVDLHADTLLWKRDMLDRAERGHVDLPRLREGNVALQVFSSVTKTPRGQNYDSNSADSDNITLLAIGQMQPVRTWRSLLERSLWHAEKLERAIETGREDIYQVWTPADIDRLMEARKDAPKPVGALFSAEGLQSLEGDPDNLDRLYAAGMRMAGLTHFFDNELAGSMHGIEKGGLTPMGRDVIRRMEAAGLAPERVALVELLKPRV